MPARLISPDGCALSGILRRLSVPDCLGLLMAYADQDWLRTAFEDPELDTLDMGIGYLDASPEVWPARVFLIQAGGRCRAVYLTQKAGEWFIETQATDQTRADQMGERGRRVLLG